MDKKSTNGAGAEPATEKTNTTTSEQATPTATTPTQPTVAVVEPSNAPTPETMPATDAATGAPVDTVVIVKPPKKKKTGLIVGIIIAILLVLGGIGFGIWYFAVYQNPEKVVFDAVNNLITAKNVQTTGEVRFYAPYEDDDETTVGFRIKLKNDAKTLPTATTAELSMFEIDLEDQSVVEDHEITIELGTVQMSDGVIYLRVSQLTDALDAFFDEDSQGIFEAAFYEVAELIEGEWWRISIPELIDDLSDSGLDLPDSELKEYYNCAIQAISKDYSEEFSILYRRTPFVVFQNVYEGQKVDGHFIYDVSLDYDNLADFLNELPHTEYSTEVIACYNNFLRATDNDDEIVSPSDIKKITASDLKDIFSEAPYLHLDITSSTHRLASITFSNSNDEHDELTFSGYFQFVYEPVEVSAPAEYRPITELFDEIGEIIYDLYYGTEYPDFSCDEDDPDLCY